MNNTNVVDDAKKQNVLDEHRLKREETEKCLKKVHEYIEKTKKEEQLRKEAQEKLHKLENRAATANAVVIDDQDIIDDTIICDTEDDDENENDGDLVMIGAKKKPFKEFNYEFIAYDKRMEKNIDKIKDLRNLTSEMINYMVLRDINYFMNIFSGQCDHSWRHQEYKKTSHKSSKILHSQAALSSFKEEQYMSALKALQSVFSRTHHRYDQYLIKVLLPEALIKICMRVHQCGKDDADNFLRVNSLQNPIEFSKRNEHFNLLL